MLGGLNKGIKITLSFVLKISLTAVLRTDCRQGDQLRGYFNIPS